MLLAERNAVITGAATGIGRASALRFAREGARLMLTDLNDEEGKEVVETIRHMGGQARFLHADVSRPGDNERVIDACIEAFGSIDILFCNAGAFFPGEITETPDEEIEKLLSVNLKALMYASRHAVPYMLRQGSGNILFTASKTGIVAQEDSPLYCATKGAVIQLARALALDYARRGIRVNALCPGMIDTPMLRNAAQKEADPDATWERWADEQPIGRIGSPEECADAAVWLVSDEARYVTGVALPVDGGFTAK